MATTSALRVPMYSGFFGFGGPLGLLVILLVIGVGTGCSALVNPDDSLLGGADDGSVGTGDTGPTDTGTEDGGATDGGGGTDGGVDATVVCPGGCDDGVACTVDQCLSGSCVHTPSNMTCAEGEYCDAALDCVRGSCATDGDCNDGLYCNGEERCSPDASGADAVGCVGGDPVACDDGAACSREACDEAANACAVTLDHSSCDDAIDCSVDRCAPGSADSNAAGCINRPDDTLCAGDFCTTGQRCNLEAGGCNGGGPRDCRDGDACTTDVCDSAASTCVNAPRDDDGDGYPLAMSGSAMCALGTDCDDTSPSVHPGATELCNGQDDDCDGSVDEGCASVPDTCSDAQEIRAFPGGGTVTVRGTFADFGSDYQSPCGRTGGRDAVYYVDVSSNVDLTIDTIGSPADTVLSVATRCDLTGFAELGCDDDIAPGGTSASRIWVHRFGPTAGSLRRRLYILVDGYGPSTNGDFQLNVRARLAAGDSCTGPINISGGGSLIGFVAGSVLPVLGPTGSCQPSGSGSDVEAVAAFRGPPDGSADFNVYSDDFDPDVYVRQAPCISGTEVACVAGDGVGAAGFFYNTDLRVTTRSDRNYYLFADGAAGGDSYWVSYSP